MVVSLVRFVTLVLTGLTLGLAFCHVVEMPPKLALTPAEYMLVQRIYTMFGPVASLTEPGAILLALVLAVLVRRRRAAFALTLVAALCLVAALGLWAAVVNPVNAHWAASGAAVPADFELFRQRWEYGHVAHAMLVFAAFVTLVASVLVEIPPTAVMPVARLDAARRRMRGRDRIA